MGPMRAQNHQERVMVKSARLKSFLSKDCCKTRGIKLTLKKEEHGGARWRSWWSVPLDLGVVSSGPTLGTETLKKRQGRQ